MQFNYLFKQLLLNIFIELAHLKMCSDKNNDLIKLLIQIEEIFAAKLGYESVQQKNIRYCHERERRKSSLHFVLTFCLVYSIN